MVNVFLNSTTCQTLVLIYEQRGVSKHYILLTVTTNPKSHNKFLAPFSIRIFNFFDFVFKFHMQNFTSSETYEKNLGLTLVFDYSIN